MSLTWAQRISAGLLFLAQKLRLQREAIGHDATQPRIKKTAARRLPRRAAVLTFLQGQVSAPAYAERSRSLEHDPEKHALGPRPDGWKPVFPRDQRERCPEIMLKQKDTAGV